ncbi:hypothetical protein TELCIR_12103 [Teladorsagia circumcincta]|uniref:Uncharacterized protein n=1 Tax=Teladorsagia circumcincta TaxID=45464 RepID=A0A2G9U7J8_TELCI|nr:hypothetical protein TELCIR_12103 [Teladorsagia circumcincta]
MQFNRRQGAKTRSFEPDDLVFARDFYAEQPRWSPERILLRHGRTLYDVLVQGSIRKRHGNQLRPRASQKEAHNLMDAFDMPIKPTLASPTRTLKASLSPVAHRENSPKDPYGKHNLSDFLKNVSHDFTLQVTYWMNPAKAKPDGLLRKGRMEEIELCMVKKNQPDELDTEVIEQLVDRFLNTGSLTDKNAPKSANPAAQALVGSSIYWDTEGIKEPGSIKDEATMKKWIEGYQTEAQKVLKEVAAAGWKYFSHASQGAKQSLNEAEQAKQFDLESITDPDLKRQLGYVAFEGMSALSPAEYAAFNQAQNTVSYTLVDEFGHGARLELTNVRA